jgi:hypothetical protein
MIHVVAALGRGGNIARPALPSIAKAKGYDATLNTTVDTAQQAILQVKGKVAPPQPGRPAKSRADFLNDLGNQKDVLARLAAAKALAQYAGDARVLPALLKAMNDPDADVALVATHSAKAVQTALQPLKQQTVDRLVQILRDPANDVNVRLVAAKALGSLGEDAASARDDLTRIANDPKADPDLKSTAANALKMLKP